MKAILKAFSAVLLFTVAVLGFYVPRYIFSDAKITPSEKTDDTMTIMSTNVRCYEPFSLFKESWFYRADLIAEDIKGVQPDIIGFQEATSIQYGYLKRIMNGYDSEMAYRDNYILSEGCPIFYRTDRFEKIDGGSFWLSETPDVMSKDWGSKHYRICVYVVLRDRTSNKEFAIFNTHLDHTSDQARINEIGVILKKIAELGDIPTYLIGDMNAKENSKTIKATRRDFDDAMKISEITESTPTYHNWGDTKRAKRIDYILISKDDALVYEYGVVDNLHGDTYSSDHASIFVKTKLK